MLAAIAVANRTRLPEGPLADVNGGVAPRKGMAELLGAHRLRLRLAVTVFAWFTVSLVRADAWWPSSTSLPTHAHARTLMFLQALNSRSMYAPGAAPLCTTLSCLLKAGSP